MQLNYKHKGRGFWASGVRGTGKSTLVLEFVRNYPADHVLIFDHQGEFADRIPTFACRTWDDCEAAWRAGKAVCFDPRTLYPGIATNAAGREVANGQKEAFAEWCRRSWVWMNEDPFKTKLYVWDESGSSVPVHNGYDAHPARNIVEQGRIRGVDLLWTTQQTNQANNQLRNQATDVFAFRHADETACDWLTSKGLQWADLQALPDGEFIYKSDRSATPTRGTVALGK